jgi:sec-independent protein translocase protein TatA
MPSSIGWTGAVVIILVLLIIFGPKRLPEMGRSLGRGMREFKDSLTGNESEEESEQPQLTQPQPQPTQPAPTAPTPPDAQPQPQAQTQPESERVSP